MIKIINLVHFIIEPEKFIQSVKYVLSGPPKVGKSVFVQRLQGKIVNLSTTGPKVTMDVADNGMDWSNNPDAIIEECDIMQDTRGVAHNRQIIDIDGQYGLYLILSHVLQGPVLHLVVFDISVDLTNESSLINENGLEMCYIPVQILHYLLSCYYDNRSRYSRAVLLATHVDKVDGDWEILRRKDKELRNYFGQANFVSKNFLMSDPNSEFIFVPVNNLEGTEDEISEITTLLHQQFGSTLAEVEILFSQSSFLKELQTRGNVVKYSECIEIAKKCELNRKEIPEILSFASQEIGSFLYYKEAELQDIIFNIKDFIFAIKEVLRCISSSNKAVTNTGLFLKESINEFMTQSPCNQLLVDVADIINLLKHYNILIELKTNEFFMPCFLPLDTDISDITEDEIGAKNPILLQFKECPCSAIFFYTIIAKIAQELSIDESSCYSNHLQIRYNHDTNISLLCRYSYLEIQVNGGFLSDAFDHIKTALYSLHNQIPPFLIGFYCQSLHPRPHFSKLEGPDYMSMACSEFSKCPMHQKFVTLSDSHKEWLMSHTPMAKVCLYNIQILSNETFIRKLWQFCSH